MNKRLNIEFGQARARTRVISAELVTEKSAR